LSAKPISDGELSRFIQTLVQLGIVQVSRNVGPAKVYRLNEQSPIEALQQTEHRGLDESGGAWEKFDRYCRESSVVSGLPVFPFSEELFKPVPLLGV